MANPLRILMVAAENDGIKTPKGQEAKVGGMGDVVRDTPLALASLSASSVSVTVLTPAYGFLNKLEGSNRLRDFEFLFSGVLEKATIYEVAAKSVHPRVRHLVLDSPLFEWRHPESKQLMIYCADPPTRPFATDATKFACFCAAVAEGLKRNAFGDVNRLHLHDWHAAFLLILRRFDKNHELLKQLRTVYTIHNLALQGIRPLTGRGDSSSLATWYPQLVLSADDLECLIGPEYKECVNPMAVGIRLADAVHVVSPGYKQEILQPSLPRRGAPDAKRFGGEGLEADLGRADADGRLFGILNGCEYDTRQMPLHDQHHWQQLLEVLDKTVARWSTEASDPTHDLALKRISELWNLPDRPTTLLTCVTRVVDQKVRLMKTPDHKPSIQQILGSLPKGSLLILLGNGDRELEMFLYEMSCRFGNFLFLKGFDSASAASLYANGDLFLMPSSFEPCGISQMLAMRDGQPCVVHNVGGLKDTVKDGVTGFSFSGETPEQQANEFVICVNRAIDMKQLKPHAFEAIRHAAFGSRFPWSTSVQDYVRFLYR